MKRILLIILASTIYSCSSNIDDLDTFSRPIHRDEFIKEIKSKKKDVPKEVKSPKKIQEIVEPKKVEPTRIIRPRKDRICDEYVKLKDGEHVPVVKEEVKPPIVEDKHIPITEETKPKQKFNILKPWTWLPPEEPHKCKNDCSNMTRDILMNKKSVKSNAKNKHR